MNAVVEKSIPTEVTPMQMLQLAVQRGDDMEKLKQLMDLRDRYEATEARKAFVNAVADFKSEPMRILKTKQVNIPGGAKFAHATLADVVDGVVVAMSKYGLSHKWELEQTEGRIAVTCVLTHALGHSERTRLEAPPDDSGKKNTIQQIASTITYLERYTLMAATGLAAKGMDDDGAASDVPLITDKQEADLLALITEGGGDLNKLLRYFRIDSLSQIPVKNFEWAVGEVKRFAKARQEARK